MRVQILTETVVKLLIEKLTAIGTDLTELTVSNVKIGKNG